VKYYVQEKQTLPNLPLSNKDLASPHEAKHKTDCRGDIDIEAKQTSQWIQVKLMARKKTSIGKGRSIFISGIRTISHKIYQILEYA